MRHFTQETPAVPGEAHGGDAFTARCSHSQTRFWLLDQLRPGDPSLHVAARWRLAGRLDAETLTRAFRILIDRHEALRTSIVGEGGRAHPFGSDARDEAEVERLAREAATLR